MMNFDVKRAVHAHANGRLLSALMVGTALSFGVLPSLLPAGQAFAQAARQFSFNIPGQPLNRALRTLSDQSGLQIAYNTAIAAGVRSQPITGTMTVEQALERLLTGSGIGYSFTGANTVTIVTRVAQASDTPDDGSTVLETITVSGSNSASPGMPFNTDTPYATAGSIAHISGEQLSRVPATSPGDMLAATPGVMNGGNRVGTSLNPNIRGMQGMGRVNTTVDGAINSTTSYRGYAGTRDETYVDPDMIGGIDITKGPSDGVGAGGIGGSIAMRTLNAEDLVRDGEAWGVRLKGSLASNSRTPLFKPLGVGPDLTRDAEPNDFLNNDNWSGSVATGTMHENFESVLAISRRQQGNYFVGNNNVPDGFIFSPDQSGTNPPGRNAVVVPGGEVYNTSATTDSILAKGKLKWDDGHSLELGYMLYDSLAGEQDEVRLNIDRASKQGFLSRTRVDTYTARYRYDPTDNPFINLRANLWHTNLDHERDLGSSSNARNHSMATTGADISNRSILDTGFGRWTFDLGAEFRHENAWAAEVFDRNRLESRGPNGVRTLTSGFGKTTFEPTDWLEVSAGGRLDHYSAEGKRIAAIHADRSQSRFSPNFGVVVKPFDGAQIFAQYKEGLRPPSLRELYWAFPTGSLRVNPDLQGEVSKNWEFGFNLMQEGLLADDDKLRFKAAYFRNRYDDFITFELVPGGNAFSGPFEFTNINKANYHGIELSGSYENGLFFAEGAFTKYLTAEYCTASGCRLPDLTGRFVADITPATYVPPEWTGSLTLGLRDEALTLGTRMQFSSTRYGSSWPAPAGQVGLVGLNFTWPEFVVFDLFGSYKFNEDTMLNFSVENITDQYYYGPLATTGMPSPGRTARISLTHRLGGNGIPTGSDLFAFGMPSFSEPRSDWTGFHIGGHLGSGMTSASGDITRTGAASASAIGYSDSGVSAGLQVGYDRQLDNRVVLGLEGDFSMLGQKSGKINTLATESAALIAGGYLESQSEYELDWTASLRGRLGYSLGRLMVYGTGGVSVLQQSGTRMQYASNTLTSSRANPNPLPTSTEPYLQEATSATSIGWTAGAGVEFALTSSLSIKGEYSYADFGAVDFNFDQARQGVTRTYRTCSTCTPARTDVPGSLDKVEGHKASIDTGIHMFKVGLNYRF